MAEARTLVICLNSENISADTLAFDLAEIDHNPKPLDQHLSLLEANQQIRLVISSLHLYGLRISLPRTSSRVAEQALHWKIEPHLGRPFEEISYNHIREQTNKNELAYRITVADKAKLQQWHEQITALGFGVEDTYFAADLLGSLDSVDSIDAGAMSYGQLGNHVLWKSKDGSGVFEENSPPALRLKRKEDDAEIDSDSTLAQIKENLDSGLATPNLLPQKFRKIRHNPIARFPLRTTRVAAICGLIPIFVISALWFIQAQQYQQAAAEIMAAARSNYQEIAPETYDPRGSLERMVTEALATMGISESISALTFITSVSEPITSEFHDISIRSLSFNGDTESMDITLSASDMDRVTELQARLTNRQIASQVRSANASAEGLRVALQMEQIQ